MDLAAWEGVWVLDPEASDFGERPVPERGSNTLLAGEHGLRIDDAWREGSTPRALRMDVRPGGTVALEDGSLLACSLDEGALITELRAEGGVLHRTVRRLHDDALHVRHETSGEAPFTAVYRRSRVKQVMVYRRDLEMRKGKIAAQCAHGSLGVFTRRGVVTDSLTVPLDGPMTWWLTRGSAKVVLSVADEDDLLRVLQLAREADLPCRLVTDSGRTEFGGVPTRTVVALGPAPVPWIDAITGRDGAVETKLA